MNLEDIKQKFKKLWIFIKFNIISIIFSLTLSILSVIIGILPGFGDFASAILTSVNFFGSQALTLWKFYDIIFA